MSPPRYHFYTVRGETTSITVGIGDHPHHCTSLSITVGLSRRPSIILDCSVGAALRGGPKQHGTVIDRPAHADCIVASLRARVGSLPVPTRRDTEHSRLPTRRPLSPTIGVDRMRGRPDHHGYDNEQGKIRPS